MRIAINGRPSGYSGTIEEDVTPNWVAVSWLIVGELEALSVRVMV